MHIAICEDTTIDLDILKRQLESYLNTHKLSAHIHCFESGEAFLASFAPEKYQIIFMDIFMAKGGLTGMDVAAEIRKADREAAVILTTTSEDYLLSGYDVALYYMVKPVEEENLKKAMEKCHRQIERYNRSIEITVNRQPLVLPLHHIRYVEALQRSCMFMTIQGELRSNMPFEAVVGMLTGLPFLRCHRSYIINLSHVRDMDDRDFVMESGVKVPISRPYLPEMQRKFQQFLVDRLRGIL